MTIIALNQTKSQSIFVVEPSYIQRHQSNRHHSFSVLDHIRPISREGKVILIEYSLQRDSTKPHSLSTFLFEIQKKVVAAHRHMCGQCSSAVFVFFHIFIEQWIWLAHIHTFLANGTCAQCLSAQSFRPTLKSIRTIDTFLPSNKSNSPNIVERRMCAHGSSAVFVFFHIFIEQWIWLAHSHTFLANGTCAHCTKFSSN